MVIGTQVHNISIFINNNDEFCGIAGWDLQVRVQVLWGLTQWDDRRTLYAPVSIPEVINTCMHHLPSTSLVLRTEKLKWTVVRGSTYSFEAQINFWGRFVIKFTAGCSLHTNFEYYNLPLIDPIYFFNNSDYYEQWF